VIVVLVDAHRAQQDGPRVEATVLSAEHRRSGEATFASVRPVLGAGPEPTPREQDRTGPVGRDEGRTITGPALGACSWEAVERPRRAQQVLMKTWTVKTFLPLVA
jgi:hypothetical protein